MGKDDSFLGQLNNSLTAIGAIVGTLGTIVATIAAMQATGAREEASSAKGQAKAATAAIKDLENRQIALEANYKFAKAFLDSMGGMPGYRADRPNEDGLGGTSAPTKPPAQGSSDTTKTATATPDEARKMRRIQLAALDIVAKASTADEGDSPAEERATLPLYIALSEGDAGALAAMDQDMVHLDKWKKIAAVDTDDRSRITAIKALVAIARWAYLQKDYDKALKALFAINELTDVAPSDDYVNNAISRGNNLVSANLILDPANLSTVPGEKNGLSKLLDARDAILSELKAISQGRNGKSQKPLQFELTGDQKSAVDALIARLDAQNTQAVLDAGRKDSALQSAVLDATEKNSQEEVVKLLGDFTSSNDLVRHSARAKFAMYGQEAVAPLYAALEKIPADSNDSAAYRGRLGIALALRNLRQPLKLDDEQIQATIEQLLCARDRDTRRAALDFFINLEEESAIATTFKKLRERVDGAISNPVAYDPPAYPDYLFSGLINAVTVVGGWTTALSPDAKIVVDGKTKTKAREVMSEQLKKWTGTIGEPTTSAKLKGEQWDRFRTRLAEMMAKPKVATKP